jgi:hypothetical protein
VRGGGLVWGTSPHPESCWVVTWHAGDGLGIVSEVAARFEGWGLPGHVRVPR